MKSNFKLLGLLLLASTLFFTSCRTEEMVQIDAEDEVIGANSNVSNLIQRTASNDGSFDNIIDGASCFDIQFPYTVEANGIEVEIENEGDIEIVENIFDEFPNDTDTLEIQFPITIVFANYTTAVINTQTEFEAAVSACPSEGLPDDDIECIDFQYPITVAIYDSNNELLDTVVITSDEELFDLIDEIESNLIVTFEFPITMILFDGTLVVVNDFQELEDVIENAEDLCDEDDDNDPNDDDCEDCSVSDLIDVLTDCTDWVVDVLERNDTDLEDIYVGYTFNFNSNGVLSVETPTTTINGTWEATGTTSQDITLSIDLSELTDFNADWILHEIDEEVGETKIDLRIGEDRLRFESPCTTEGGGGGDPDDTALVEALTNGDWYVNFYFDDVDETANYADYVFNFDALGTTTATANGIPTIGAWSTGAGDETELELNLNYGIIPPLSELADDWDVLEVTQDIIRLKDVSGGDGSEEFLTFGREPFSGGGGGGGNIDLEEILTDGIWEITSYLDDGIDETAAYLGYTVVYNITGTVVATNGTSTATGTWEVTNNGNQLNLDFLVQIPFDEFNDNWDVLFANETRIELQDVSGGGGGTDTLVFEKL